MIRSVRLWTGDDDKSHFEEDVIEPSEGERGAFPAAKSTSRPDGLG
jgi:hypothetical protein